MVLLLLHYIAPTTGMQPSQNKKMEKEKNSEIIISSLPRLGFLLWAISPIIENIDWLFYTCVILGILSVLAFAISLITVYKKNRKNFPTYFLGTPRDNLFDLFISIAGIIICYSLGIFDHAYLWLFLLTASILQLLFPSKNW
jgi:hypothetical protein